MSILKIKESQGNWISVPTIKGDKGNTGNGISSAILNDDYTLTLTFTDGTTYKTPSIRGEKGQTGDTPTITASKTGKTTSIYVDGSEIAQIEDGTDGTNGDDGYSPTASVSKSGKVATITITDKNGTTSAQVEDGTDGTDGVSPTVTITPITGGHRITITDADGSHSADVMDGDDYTLTAQDKQDIAELVDVPVEDVQINGTSIVENGVANVPIASDSQVGAVKVVDTYGAYVDDGVIKTSRATSSAIKSATGMFKPITPDKQHESTFYGLAKAAGYDEKNSTLPVGQYTEDAKSAIQDMIGIDDWQLVAEETLAEDGYFDITIANSAREVYIYAEVEIASGVTSLVAEAYNDSGTRVHFQTFSGQISSNKKAITVLQLTPVATEIKALAYFGKDVYTNSGHFDWQHKEFDVGKLKRFRITAYGSTIQIPTGSIVRIFAR